MLSKIVRYYLRPFTAIILIFAIVGVSFIYSTQTADTMKIQADQELEQQWRTDYDLLVSPAPYDEDNEKHMLVRRSDMGNIRGGITREQYEQIKDMDSIEIAAPLSFLGYMMAQDSSFSLRPLEEGIYVIDVETQVFDGIRYRNIPQNNSSLFFNDVIHVSNNVNDFDNFDDLMKLYVQLNWLRSTDIIIPFRSGYFWSVIGIDPDEEKKLLNLDSSVFEGEYFSNEKSLLRQNGVPLLPILLQKQAYDTNRSVRILKVNDTELSRYLNNPLDHEEELLKYGDRSFLTKLPTETLLDVQFNPFSEEFLYYFGRVDVKDGKVIKGADSISSTHSMAYVYELGALEHKNIGEWDGNMLYRTIPFATYGEQINYRSLSLQFEEKGFGYDIYGLFDPTLLQNPYTTSKEPRSPDFYNPDTVYITHDTEGNAYEEPIEYQSPPNKEGYSTGGVDALTTLEAAEYFLGDEPISVIRVVVEGAGERSAESMAKVERVAEQIRQETGLHVDVMLGAADRKVQVLLDDFEGVPGYGYLLEGWSEAGTSFVIEDRVDATNLLLSSYILFMGLLGVSLVYRNYVEVRRKDIHVQYTFGWNKSAILKQLLMEGSLILLLVGIILLVCKFTIGLSWTWVQFGIASGLLGLIAILSILLMYVVPLMRGLDEKTNLRASGQGILPVLTNTPSLTLWGYLGHSLVRYGVRSLLKLLILVATMVYVFLFLITKAGTSSFLMLTFLGENINLMLEPYQWVLFGLGLVLSAGCYVALQINQVENRTQEIQLFQAWGWRTRRWLSLYLIEELVITLSAILLGLGLGFALLSSLASTKVVTPIAVVILTLSTILFVLSISAFGLSTRSKQNRLREFN